MSPRAAAGVARWWTRLYTAGLPADLRDARRAEVESDLLGVGVGRRPVATHPRPAGAGRRRRPLLEPDADGYQLSHDRPLVDRIARRSCAGVALAVARRRQRADARLGMGVPHRRDAAPARPGALRRHAPRDRPADDRMGLRRRAGLADGDSRRAVEPRGGHRHRACRAWRSTRATGANGGQSGLPAQDHGAGGRAASTRGCFTRCSAAACATGTREAAPPAAVQGSAYLSLALWLVILVAGKLTPYM